MLGVIKKQIKVLWMDWLWNVAVVFGGSLTGFVMFQVILRFNSDIEEYFSLGTVLGGALAVIFIGFTIMMSIGIYFNVEVSMGCPRKRFFASYFIVSLVECLLGMGALVLVCMAENSANRILHPALGNEKDFLPYLLKWSLPAAVILTVISVLCGTLVIRFGRKAYWMLWCIWMFVVLCGPRISDAVTDAPDSAFGRLGRAIGAVVTAIPGNAWIPCMAVISAAGLAVSYALLHRQQVNS